MSRTRRTPDGFKLEVADDAQLKPMVLTGLVRTSRGYAVAIAHVAADGSLTSFRIGPSQSEKRFAAIAHKEALVKAALEA
jgi:hypothetical protein